MHHKVTEFSNNIHIDCAEYNYWQMSFKLFLRFLMLYKEQICHLKNKPVALTKSFKYIYKYSNKIPELPFPIPVFANQHPHDALTFSRIFLKKYFLAFIKISAL